MELTPFSSLELEALAGHDGGGAPLVSLLREAPAWLAPADQAPGRNDDVVNAVLRW